jgi:hypothetical protein
LGGVADEPGVAAVPVAFRDGGDGGVLVVGAGVVTGAGATGVNVSGASERWKRFGVG